MAKALAAPALRVIVFEVAAVKLVGVKINVNAPAVPVITKLVKVATPFTAATVVAPVSVPVPVPILAITFTVDEVTVLLSASVIRITGWVVKARPFTAPDG